ncbi:MAG: hypothetical protein ACOC7U_01780 [Spirochaetota bacterium]
MDSEQYKPVYTPSASLISLFAVNLFDFSILPEYFYQKGPALAMDEACKKRTHHFEFPGQSGCVSIELESGCFPEIDDDELIGIGSLVRDLIYGMLLEDKNIRHNYLNIFRSVLKDSALTVEDKDFKTLLRYSNKLFHQGDYSNSLFLSQFVLTRINQIIDNKLANNHRLVDKELIQLQISTLNFIAYLFAKTNRNVDYGVKLVTIANTLLNEFDENSNRTLELRAAIFDTLGALYINKEDWDNAIENLTIAHQYDRSLLSRGQVNEIGFRLTCSNLGYALVKKCNYLIDNHTEKLNIHQVEKDLETARRYFMMVQVEKPPPVPENMLKDLELWCAIKRMKRGVYLCEEVRKKLQKRFI